MSDWDFGGAFANTAETLQRTDQAAQAFPLDQLHRQATTRFLGAEAGLMEHKLQAEKDMARIMRGMQIGQPGEPQSASLMKMAGAAMQAGDNTAAQNLILHASQVRAQETREAMYQAQQAKQEAERGIKMADRYGQMMRGVRSKEEFEIANRLFEQEFGEQPPAMEYNPRTVQILGDSAMRMSDQIRKDHNAAMEKLDAAKLGEQRAYHSELLKHRKLEEEGRNARAQGKAKEGGKDVGAPSKGETEAARDLIEREGKAKGLDASSSRSAAFDLASRARALRKGNPGLSAGEAMQRALVEQISEGYYSTQQATRLPFLNIPLGRDKASYGKPGGSAARALAVPADRSTLKPQTYYQTPRGSLLYLGKGQWQAPEAAPETRSSEDDDEEE